MNAELVIRERRQELSGRLAYRYDQAETGHAVWRNISRAGACVEFGRYLRPGRVLTLSFVSLLDPGQVVELPARVVWCRQISGHTEFLAGLSVLRVDPVAALGFAALGHAARRSPADVERLRAPLLTVTPSAREARVATLEQLAAVSPQPAA